MFRLSLKSMLSVFVLFSCTGAIGKDIKQSPLSLIWGYKCGKFVARGLTALVKNISPEVALTRDALRSIAHESVVRLKSQNVQEKFIRGMIEGLSAWKIEPQMRESGGLFDVTANERAMLFMLQEMGVILLNRQLKNVEFSYMGLGIDMNSYQASEACYRILFPTIFLPLDLTRDVLHMYAISAVTACHRAGLACNETEYEVFQGLKDFAAGCRVNKRSNAIFLAVELMHGEIGRKVTEFLCESHLFAGKTTFRLWRFGLG